MTDDTIALAERILQLLDEGAFTATYKYAVLLALLDLCLERTAPDGTAPGELTTRQLALKVTELYWPQTVDYPQLPGGPGVLRQNRSRHGTQAEIVRRIGRFRGEEARDPTGSLAFARSAAPEAFERLLDFVEWKLIEMPLPRLQTIGGERAPFLYDIPWGTGVRRTPVVDYQSGRVFDFDNRIRLNPGVGARLVALNGLLRPIIQRRWVDDVASINRLPESELQAFLFGPVRTPTRAVRTALLELQGGRCFYCGRPVGGRGLFEVDHFIPWVRHPSDAMENLVAADRACNNHKRAHLAATSHVERWLGRLSGASAREIESVARDVGWETSRERVLGVATSIYLGLPDHFALWLGQKRFEQPDRATLRRAFLGVR